MQTSSFTWYPQRKETIWWEVREVVHDLEKRPHLLLRFELAGVFCPRRALPPFVRVGKVQSRFVRFDPDGLRVLGYFDVPLPDRGTIVFGYGAQVVLEIHREYVHELANRLDRKRIPEGTRVYDALERPA